MEKRNHTRDGGKCIGVFDSGLGGLTVVRQLTALLPGEDIVYLGDTARVPYGIRSLALVRRFALEDAAFLRRFDPKLIVVACNTASAAAVDVLEEACPMGVVDVVRPGAAEALRRTDGPIAVIATEGTIKSGAYQRAILAADPNREVMAAACPLLVGIVEEGRDSSDPIVLHVLSDYLHDLQRRRPGAMILGCTHYPLLSEAIAKLMGPETSLVDSGQAAALEIQRRLCQTGQLNGQARDGWLRCYTTDNAERFLELGQKYGGRTIDHVETVGTDELSDRPL